MERVSRDAALDALAIRARRLEFGEMTPVYVVLFLRRYKDPKAFMSWFQICRYICCHMGALGSCLLFGRPCFWGARVLFSWKGTEGNLHVGCFVTPFGHNQTNIGVLFGGGNGAENHFPSGQNGGNLLHARINDLLYLHMPAFSGPLCS